jgi:hypothetical protein
MSPKTVYGTDELLAYLRDLGYREPEILQGVHRWQDLYFRPHGKSCERFTLSDAGDALLSRPGNQ